MKQQQQSQFDPKFLTLAPPVRLRENPRLFCLPLPPRLLLLLLPVIILSAGCNPSQFSHVNGPGPGPAANPPPLSVSQPLPTSTPVVTPTLVPAAPPPLVTFSLTDHLFIWGDEWITRLAHDQDFPNWTASPYPSPSSMSYNLSIFWDDTFQFLAPEASPAPNGALSPNSILYANFNPVYSDPKDPNRCLPPSAYTSFLPAAYSGFLSHYHFVDLATQPGFSSSTAGIADPTMLTYEYLAPFKGFMFISYSRNLSAAVLKKYLQNGGHVMPMAVGYGVPCLDPSSSFFAAAGGNPATAGQGTPNFECLNMNTLFDQAGFGYEFDCGNFTGNFIPSNDSIFANIPVPSAIPVDGGYPVLPSPAPQSPYCH